MGLMVKNVLKEASMRVVGSRFFKAIVKKFQGTQKVPVSRA